MSCIELIYKSSSWASKINYFWIFFYEKIRNFKKKFQKIPEDGKTIISEKSKKRKRKKMSDIIVKFKPQDHDKVIKAVNDLRACAFLSIVRLP